jgi:hypothetical protein
MKLKTTPDDVFYYCVVSFSVLMIAAWIISLIGVLMFR